MSFNNRAHRWAQTLGDFSSAHVQRRFAWVALLLLGLPLVGFSQTNRIRSAPTGPNRYLLICETSDAMKRCRSGTLDAVQALLDHGFSGQLRSGDTLGVWTYDEELYTGRVPLKHWSPSEHKDITEEIIKFLRKHKYRGEANFEKVRPGLDYVIHDSALITVILVSTGMQDIKGTPFDNQINQVYAKWRDSQQQERKPFVTILRARKGEVVDALSTPAQWPVELAPLPPPKPVEVAQKAAPPAPDKPKPVIGQPLIVSGKKPAEPEVATPPVSKPLPATRAAPPPTTPSSTTEVRPKPDTTPPPSSPTTVPAKPAIASAEGQPSVALAPPMPSEQFSSTPLPRPASATKTPLAAAPDESPKLAPSSPARAQPDVAPPAARDQAAMPVNPPAGYSKTPPEQPQPAPPIAAAAPPVWTTTAKLFLAAILLLVTASVVILIWVRRARQGQGTSLITRSLDRK